MAKSKKKVTTKASPTVKSKPNTSKNKPAPQTKSKPSKPAKKQAKPAAVVKKPAVKQSKSKAKPVAKPIIKSTAKKGGKSGKKEAPKKSGSKKAKEQVKKGKTKEVASKKGGKSNKKQTPKKAGKKGGSKKQNLGSTNYQKIKLYIQQHHKRRTNIDDKDPKVADKKATQVAQAIYQWLKVKNKIVNGKITQKLIREALDELYPQTKRKRKGRRIYPEIPERLQSPQPFYDAQGILDDMGNGLFDRVWIFSPLILGKYNNAYIYLSPTVTYTYEETFQEWVNWVNALIADGTLEGGSPPEMHFKFTDVFYNTIHKRFEVKLIPCDESGTQFNSGFVPNGMADVPPDDDNVEERFGEKPDELPVSLTPEVGETPITPQPPTVTPAPPAGEAKEIIEEKVKTEKLLQKGIELDNKNKQLDVLNKIKESIMADLRFDKEMGFEIKPEAIARLTAIRKQIDDLSK